MAYERMSQYTEPGHFDERDEERLGGRVRQAYGRAQEVVGEHPAYSVLACFGIGVGVGAVLTLLLSPEKKQTAWYEDYLPDGKLRHEVAQQVRETVGRLVPDAVARYLKRR